jgi:hypothetical protein
LDKLAVWIYRVREISMKLFAGIFFAAISAFAQTNDSSATNSALAAFQHAEQVRAECLQGRRQICGKILRVLPEGLVVESGYADLLRPPLTDSWLVSGTATSTMTPNLIEQKDPGAVCVGTIFLSDLPKARGKKPKAFDYVILTGYPAGEHTYTSVGTVQKTARHFTGNVAAAVKLRLAAEQQKTAEK